MSESHSFNLLTFFFTFLKIGFQNVRIPLFFYRQLCMLHTRVFLMYMVIKCIIYLIFY